MKKKKQQTAVLFTTKDLDPYLEEIRNGQLRISWITEIRFVAQRPWNILW